MNLAELYAQQQRDLETFDTIRDKTWATMKNDHHAIIAAHGGRDKLPPEYRKRMDEQVSDFHKQWSKDGGTHHKEMLEQHAKQREAMMGKPSENMAQAKRQQKDMISEKQKELKKIIERQKAIQAKQEQKKQQKGRSR